MQLYVLCLKRSSLYSSLRARQRLQSLINVWYLFFSVLQMVTSPVLNHAWASKASRVASGRRQYSRKTVGPWTTHRSLTRYTGEALYDHLAALIRHAMGQWSSP